MVRHQAVGVNLEVKGILQLTQNSQVSLVIFVSGKPDLTVVPALHDMVRVIRQNKTAIKRPMRCIGRLGETGVNLFQD
jgi:hypothetical protein